MIGEIGGDAEERAAAYIKDYVPAGGRLRRGVRCAGGKDDGACRRHRRGSVGTALAKQEALEAAGVKVGKTPSGTAELMREIMASLTG